MFKVFAEGQLLSPGSNVQVTLDPTTVTEGCGGQVVDGFFDPIPQLVQLPPGTYNVSGLAEFIGTVTSNHGQIDAFDDTQSFSTGNVGPGASIPLSLPEFTFLTTGWVALLAGPGSGISGVSVTSASFLQINCVEGGWRVGRVRWPNPAPIG